MVQQIELLHVEDFVSSSTIVVSHSLNQHFFGVQCVTPELFGGVIPAGKFTIDISNEHPDDIFTVSLPVTASGRIQVFSHGISIPGIITNREMNDFKIISGSFPVLSSSVGSHVSAYTNPHKTGISNIVSGTLAQLNSKINDATLDDTSSSRPPSGAATGDLSGTFPSPTVAAFTSGSTKISFDNIQDGKLLKRSGNTIIGTKENVFGSEFLYAESAAKSTTSSTSYSTKLTLSSVVLTGGTYIIEVSYGWWHNYYYDSFVSRIQEKIGAGTYSILGKEHYEMPWDNTSTQKFYLTRRFIRVLPAGTYSWRLQYKNDNSNRSSSIWDTLITVTKAKS